jgi:hypothetical protein
MLKGLKRRFYLKYIECFVVGFMKWFKYLSSGQFCGWCKINSYGCVERTNKHWQFNWKIIRDLIKMGFLYAWKPLEEQIEIIKTEFGDILLLDETIKGILSLRESEIYEGVYLASKRGHVEGLSVEVTADELKAMPQVNIASNVLKKPVFYLPPITDLIIATHFLGTLHVLIWIYYVNIQRELNYQEIKKIHSKILERIMSSLDQFCVVKDYEVPDEGYYRKLKQMKWDTQGKRLFKKLEDMRGKVMVDRDWGSASSTFQTGEMFMLGFLAACNAVNHQRNSMLPEDVIIAYKTYFKLLNTDISKLEL